MVQTAIDAAMSSKMLNMLTPTGVAGIPTVWAALGTGAMKLLLYSTAGSTASSGTELTGGTGYTTSGTAFSTQSAASAAGSNVTMPLTTAISWTNGGATWTIVSLEIKDSGALRIWWGLWNGQPISVANGNTFQVAALGISAGGFLSWLFKSIIRIKTQYSKHGSRTFRFLTLQIMVSLATLNVCHEELRGVSRLSKMQRSPARTGPGARRMR